MKIKGYGIILLMKIMAFPLYASINTPKRPLTQTQVFNPYPEGKVDVATKDNMPEGCKQGTSTSWMSFMKQISPVINHPSGSKIFPDDNRLSQLLTTFLTNLNKDDASKAFVSYFNKMHILILDQLYKYLTKIYTVMNMTHFDTLQDYLTQDEKQSLNKKTLIIDHLINIIEAQSNGKMLALFPSLPQNLAVYGGNVLLKQDYGVDLSVMMDKAETIFIEDSETQAIVADSLSKTKETYLGLLSDYLRLFDQYTKSLAQDTTTLGYVGVNEFVKHAEKIVKVMQTVNQQPANLKMQDKIKWLRSLTKLNPPMFFYNVEAMRGLKLIPALAKSLPKNVQNVPWPKKIVEAAQNRTMFKPKYGPATNIPLAYFDSTGKKLFVNIPTQNYLYAQELLPQPAWLNTVDGVLKMTQACLGDFTKLLDPLLTNELVLDPCLLCIIQNAATKAGLTTSQAGSCKKECDEVMDIIKKGRGLIQKKPAPPPFTAPTIPGQSNVPPVAGGMQ